ncbi:MAG: transglutaminase family protein [Acidobacteriota bacterium]
MFSWRSSFWIVALIALGWSVHGATVVERSVAIEIRGDGKVREHESLRVRIEDRRDLALWRQHRVYLDDHRKLVSARGLLRMPDGEVRRGRRKNQDRVKLPSGNFHDSSQLLIMSFPEAVVGSVLEVRTEVEIEPYYPVESVLLSGELPVENLTVRLDGGGPSLYWKIEGDADPFDVQTLENGGLEISTTGLKPAADGPSVLRYSWASDPTWERVGQWYRELLSGVPEGGPEVARQARSLLSDSPRSTLEELTRFVQQSVRYVAVEVGIGGFQPSPPRLVLKRRWGDCKDKSMLLMEMLRAVGIDAFPALVRARQDAVDEDFPSPTQFNHLILAVPARQLATASGDAVGGGYLFVDPTQSMGGSRWLNPLLGGQLALVVGSSINDLVQIPVSAQAERRELEVNLTVDSSGDAVGELVLKLRGQAAVELLSAGPPDQMRVTGRSFVERRLSGVEIDRLDWLSKDDNGPFVELSATVRWSRLLIGHGGEFALRIPGLRLTPESRRLENEVGSVAPGQLGSVFDVTLPWPCQVAARRSVDSGDSPLGRFQQTIVQSEASRLRIHREGSLHRRWLGPSEVQALRRLIAVENRNLSRSLRLACKVP